MDFLVESLCSSFNLSRLDDIIIKNKGSFGMAWNYHKPVTECVCEFFIMSLVDDRYRVLVSVIC